MGVGCQSLSLNGSGNSLRTFSLTIDKCFLLFENRSGVPLLYKQILFPYTRLGWSNNLVTSVMHQTLLKGMYIELVFP